MQNWWDMMPYLTWGPQKEASWSLTASEWGLNPFFRWVSNVDILKCTWLLMLASKCLWLPVPRNTVMKIKNAMESILDLWSWYWFCKPVCVLQLVVSALLLRPTSLVLPTSAGIATQDPALSSSGAFRHPCGTCPNHQMLNDDPPGKSVPALKSVILTSLSSQDLK